MIIHRENAVSLVATTLALLVIGCGGSSKDAGEPSAHHKMRVADAEEVAEPEVDHEQIALDGELCDALEAGDWEAALEAIEDGADVEKAAGVSGVTDLHVACLTGDLDLVEILIEDDTDLDAPTDRGTTPMHLAASLGEIEILTALLDAGADSTLADEEGRTVLHHAILAGNEAVVTYLVNTRGIPATLDPTGAHPPLVEAAKASLLKTAKLLVSKGAKAGATDGDGLTALHHASANGDIEMVKFLLSKGAKASAQDGEGRTSLHMVAQKCPLEGECLDVAKLLTKKGAKKKGKDGAGKTPGDYAVEGEDEDLIAFLTSGKK